MKKWIVTAAAVACSLPLQAQVPGINTERKTNIGEILTNTVQALPGCLRYSVKGVCFFLRCSLYECSIETSVRVAHYVPEAIISVYQNADQHPWADVGSTVSKNSNKLEAKMMSLLSPDVSASSHDEANAIAVFKGADAYGNPVGMFSNIMAGQSTGTSDFSIPNFDNLMGFFSQELPSLAKAWAQVPAELAQGIGSQVSGMFQNSGSLLDQVKGLMPNMSSSASQLGFANGIADPMEVNVPGGSIKEMLGKTMDMAESVGIGGSEYICPTAASWLTLHFQSEIDGYFWRHIIPLELLYPHSWIPLLSNVGSWGSIYPRIGEHVQQDPYRTAGVIAERVRSIIVKENQPHIYTEMKPRKAGYITFAGRAHQWQQVYPSAQNKCISFGSVGQSPSVAERSTSNSYIWNLWQDRDCCLVKGVFLFTVP